jgi:hypothetical protein
LPIELPRLARMQMLTHSALAQACSQLAAAWPAFRYRRDIKLTSWLSLPEDARANLDQALELEAQVFDIFGPATHTVHTGGHAATLYALAQLGPPPDQLELAVLIAADSYIDRDVIRALHERGHLKTWQTPFGYVPGEAACVSILATPALAARCALPELGQLLSASNTLENNTGFASPQASADAASCAIPVCVGAALSTAFDRASREHCTQADEPRRIDNLWCDLNGQPERVDELAFTLARWSPRLRAPGAFATPASSWGDVGAATGGLLIQLAFSQPQFDCKNSDDATLDRPRLSLALANSGHAPLRAAALIQPRRAEHELT